MKLRLRGRLKSFKKWVTKRDSCSCYSLINTDRHFYCRRKLVRDKVDAEAIEAGYWPRDCGGLCIFICLQTRVIASATRQSALFHAVIIQIFKYELSLIVRNQIVDVAESSKVSYGGSWWVVSNGKRHDDV